MKTYWDLSEQERAALSREDVQRYLDAELMLKGVLKVKPLVLEAVPEVPQPTLTLFAVRNRQKYGHGDLGPVFRSPEDARQFLGLDPMQLDSEYLGHGSESVAYVRPVQEPQIVEVRAFTEEQKDMLKVQLAGAAAIAARTKKAVEVHSDAVRAQDKALEGLWEDWDACRSKDHEMRRIADTFAEYKQIAGDVDTAARFLLKVFETAQINEAAAWCGLSIPTEFVAERVETIAEAFGAPEPF